MQVKVLLIVNTLKWHIYNTNSYRSIAINLISSILLKLQSLIYLLIS